MIFLKVNGNEHLVDCPDNKTLLEVLREDLELTGGKKGCDQGECGSCTVLIDGKPFRACMMLAVEVQGNDITTVEGLAKEGNPSYVQKAFVERQGIQCGFCSAGMIMTATAFLEENKDPKEEDVVKAISGNICRCTGYNKIIKSILHASKIRGAAKMHHTSEEVSSENRGGD
jgi:carbon-monoxide dehydrogenase small subunit